jgi:hypothetical protein
MMFLYSSYFHLVSTYKYDVGNYLFDSIFYWLKCSLTSLQIKQNNMQYLKQCLTLNTQKTQECCLRELNPIFLYDIKDRINSKEDACEWKHFNTYRQNFQDVPITPCFCCETLFFWNNFKLLQIN